jgi:beta-lactamase class A
MTVDELTRRMATLTSCHRAIKNGDNTANDELIIDVYEQPYIEQTLRQTSAPSWTWLKLRRYVIKYTLIS